MVEAQDTLPPWIYVATPAALAELAEHLLRQPIVAVDTESNSLHAFQEQVCLLQFSTPQADYLVDPLALPDLSPLAPLFASPQVEKVFHGGDYDVLTLKRDFGFTFANLFDTMLAARLLGTPRLGLSALLEDQLGVRLNKVFQRADWGRRPLPPEMLDYARLDTHYLIPLRHRLKAELHERGRWDLAEEDFQRLARLTPSSENGPTWEIRGAGQLSPRERAVLAELVAYRDAVARRLNCPRFKVIPDKVLLALARAQPRHRRELARIPGLSPAQVRRHGNALLEAIARGRQAPPQPAPRQAPPDPAYLERYEALRRWRQRTARRWGVPSDAILPREVLAAIAAAHPTTPQALQQVMAHYPRRYARFGRELLQLLARLPATPPPAR